VTTEEREFLLQSLRDLERERAEGDIDEADYLALRDDYTARAAAAIRGDEPVEPAPDAAPRRRRRWRAVVLTVAVLGSGALAGELLARSAGERVAGDAVTGSIRETSTSRLGRARALFDDGKLVASLKQFDRVLADDPENVTALSYRGYIISLAGLVGEGLATLDRAIAIDPGYPFAHFFKGLVHLNARKDPAAAIPELEAFLANDPPPAMRTVVRDILDAARQAVTTTTPR
jgi:tetratricopeptide (TPR) repeat protein